MFQCHLSDPRSHSWSSEGSHSLSDTDAHQPEPDGTELVGIKYAIEPPQGPPPTPLLQIYSHCLKPNQLVLNQLLLFQAIRAPKQSISLDSGSSKQRPYSNLSDSL